jgi:hypothetical protein
LLPAVRVTFIVVLPPGEIADGVGAEITACETVTLAVPLDPAYVPSPEYVAVSVLAPLLNAPAGTVMLAAPAVRVCCALYVPLARVTVPVGVDCPLTPATVMETASDCSLVIVEDAVVTVTVDALFAVAVTVTDVEPVAQSRC